MGINPGSKYKALQLTIADGTTDYSVAENNITEFPDWSKDWDERDWYNILVIKALGKNEEIKIKLHRDDQNTIIIRDDEVPAIIDHIVFRDVFITNDSGSSASFDILFFSPDTLTGPPKRPTEVSVEEVSGEVVLSFKDNTMDDNYFIIERSTTSAVAGFGSIATPSFRNRNQMPGKIRTYTDSTVAGATQYWYRLKSYRDGLESAASDVVTVTTS